MSEQPIESTPEVEPDATEAASPATEPTPVETPEEPKVFDLEYVTKLRHEAAEARVKAKRADALAAQVVSALAASDGRLIDPDDLAFSDDMLTDEGMIDRDKVAEAITDLLARKPHLAARRPTRPLPQGVTSEPQAVSLHQMLRERA